MPTPTWILRPHVRAGLAFTAVMLGLLGAVIYIPLALEPLSRRALDIQQNYGLAIRHLSELRGDLRDARMAALLQYQARWDPRIDGERQREDVHSAWARLEGSATAYELLPRAPEEQAVWRQLRDREVPRVRAAIDAIAALRARGADDPSVVQRLVEVGSSADAAAQQLIDIHATSARLETAHLHDGLSRLSVGYAVLAALGSAGAIVLLLTTVGSLRRSAATVAKRIAELEAFAGQISHDLRSPLQAIQLSVSMIESRAADDGIRRLTARATSGVRRVDTMIRDLLQFARSGADVRSAACAEVGPIVDEILEELHAQADRAGVTLEATSEPVAAAIAPVALKTILANLVENAIKYRSPDRRNQITVAATASGDGLVSLRVADTGLGIPETLLPRIFDPFFKASQRPDSYGLGLATVKRLIDAHRGSIAVESAEGRGTCFTIVLPRAASAREGAGTARPEHEVLTR